MKSKVSIITTSAATPGGFYAKLIFLHIIMAIDVYCQMHVSLADFSNNNAIGLDKLWEVSKNSTNVNK